MHDPQKGSRQLGDSQPAGTPAGVLIKLLERIIAQRPAVTEGDRSRARRPRAELGAGHPSADRLRQESRRCRFGKPVELAVVVPDWTALQRPVLPRNQSFV